MRGHGDSQPLTHAHLLVVVESGQHLVFEAATRGDRPRHFHIRRRSAPESSALYPAVRKVGKAISLEGFQRPSPYSRMIKILRGQPTSEVGAI